MAAEAEAAMGGMDLLVNNAGTAVYRPFAEMDKVLFTLGMSFHKGKNPEKAAETFGQLRTEYPESPFIKKIPKEKKLP